MIPVSLTDIWLYAFAALACCYELAQGCLFGMDWGSWKKLDPLENHIFWHQGLANSGWLPWSRSNLVFAMSLLKDTRCCCDKHRPQHCQLRCMLPDAVLKDTVKSECHEWTASGYCLIWCNLATIWEPAFCENRLWIVLHSLLPSYLQRKFCLAKFILCVLIWHCRTFKWPCAFSQLIKTRKTFPT